jgi:hypothetical protein
MHKVMLTRTTILIQATLNKKIHFAIVIINLTVVNFSNSMKFKGYVLSNRLRLILLN